MFPLACLTWDAGEMAERGIRQSGAEGLDLHLSVDKAAGFVGRALETALREAIRSGRLHAG
jgi:hypothetical protein